VRNGIGDNVHFLYEAIKEKKQVVFHQYKSSNSHAVSDRIVEPFAFTPNNSEVWCYELSSGKNKLFKVSRIGRVEMLALSWEYEAKHQSGYTDVFHNSSDKRLPVKLRLGMSAANLLVEEYPLAERYIVAVDDGRWLLDTMVCNYLGIGRFVLGLMGDVRVVDSPDFEAYIKDEVNLMLEHINQ
jgi:predicted DNA-binding transcriptional regulator YafY